MSLLGRLTAVTGAEFVRFVAVGAFNTIFGYLLYWIFLSFLPYGAAYTAAYAMGIFVSYLLNCKVVFHCKPTWSGFLRFPLVYLVQYALSLGLLALCVERLGWDKRLAAVAVTGCSVPLTFILSRYVLKPTRDGRECAEPVAD